MKLAVALGAGSARGWSHIGVMRALNEGGVRPDIVCGSSIGALVGAVYADDKLDQLERWVTGLTWRSVLGFFDISLTGGFIKGAKLSRFLQAEFLDKRIDELPRTYGAVATDLQTGREVWLRTGRVSDAVRASIALPGLFTPFERDGQLLVDGGLVNPVPVSLARSLEADIVIGVDLNSVITGRLVREGGDAKTPSMLEVVTASINIMQVRVSRSRLAGEPADIVISPRLGQLGVLDFHRASEAIAEGYETTMAMMPQIKRLVEEGV